MGIYRVSSRERTYAAEQIKEASIEDVLSFLSEHNTYCLDTETTGLDCHTNKVLSIQIGNTKDQYVIDGTLESIPLLAPALQSKISTKIGANIGFDYKMLRSNYDIKLEHVYDVSRVDEVLFNGLLSNLHSNPIRAKMRYYQHISLKGLCKRHLGIEISKQERKSFVGMREFSSFTDKLFEYAAKDVVYPEQIFEKQAVLINRYGLGSCVSLENAVCLSIADMEYNGIGLDTDLWTKLAKNNGVEHDKLVLELDNLIVNTLGLKEYAPKAGQMDMFNPTLLDNRASCINWRSNPEVLELLKKLKFDIADTQRRSLAAFMNYGELIPKFLKLRELIKAIDTYGLSFLNYVSPTTGRIHPQFNQLFPDTGRLSCERPNLQNVKKTSAYRSCFVAGKGRKLVTADYSGQELRLMASISGEESWLEAFRNNEDLHGKLAMQTFSIPLSDIKKQAPFAPTGTTYRDVQKTIDFLIPYGGGADKLSEAFSIPLDRAKTIIDTFLSKVPKVASYLKKSGLFAKDNGYSRTFAPISRIRWYKEHSLLHSMSFAKRNSTLGDIERAGMNLGIQGTGADLIKISMVNTRNWIRDHNAWNTVKMVLQVHDELVDDVAEGFADEWAEKKRRIMLDAGEFIVKNVPMEVSIAVENKWSK